MDLFHYWGEDLQASPTGDLSLAYMSTTTKQEILRALMTNAALSDSAGNPLTAADYLDHPDFGAGLPRRIGDLLDLGQISAVVMGVVLSFPEVSRSPRPVVDVTAFNDGATISIQYVDTASGGSELLSFDIKP